ncbi:hypothetical protein B7494_g7000 [Chlorociboria aeruginascens]|nr:hypothetical protein B7494_g7000 [Chlorociboria aeruginascens]
MIDTRAISRAIRRTGQINAPSYPLQTSVHQGPGRQSPPPVRPLVQRRRRAGSLSVGRCGLARDGRGTILSIPSSPTFTTPKHEHEHGGNADAPTSASDGEGSWPQEERRGEERRSRDGGAREGTEGRSAVYRL